METKFTKGPWKVYEYNAPHWNNQDLPHVTIHYGDNEERIVDTVYELADAHLIAAAPEMYEMLEHLIPKIKDVIVGEGHYFNDCEDEAIEKLLAKAQGE